MKGFAFMFRFRRLMLNNHGLFWWGVRVGRSGKYKWPDWKKLL